MYNKVILLITKYNYMQLNKNKTQITLNPKLALIVESIMEKYPYDLNGAIEFLIARGSKDYLNEIDLTMEDLEDIKKSEKEIEVGKSIKVKDSKELLHSLKS